MLFRKARLKTGNSDSKGWILLQRWDSPKLPLLITTVIYVWSATTAAEDLIEGMEQALEEARQVSGLAEETTITLPTDNGPAMPARKFSDYIEGSSFHHIRGRSHHP